MRHAVPVGSSERDAREALHGMGVHDIGRQLVQYVIEGLRAVVDVPGEKSGRRRAGWVGAAGSDMATVRRRTTSGRHPSVSTLTS